jgi:hypothetical protein
MARFDAHLFLFFAPNSLNSAMLLAVSSKATNTTYWLPINLLLHPSSTPVVVSLYTEMIILDGRTVTYVDSKVVFDFFLGMIRYLYAVLYSSSLF